MPDRESLCASKGEEAEQDVAPFAGQSWQDIDERTLTKHYYVLYWFTPEAFHYYLPAFLVCGLNHPRAIFVVSLIQLLRPTRAADQRVFRQRRWSTLSENQTQALHDWLVQLLEQLEPAEQGEVASALEVVSRRMWWAPSG
jgi:hypothetical protein